MVQYGFDTNTTKTQILARLNGHRKKINTTTMTQITTKNCLAIDENLSEAWLLIDPSSGLICQKYDPQGTLIDLEQTNGNLVYLRQEFLTELLESQTLSMVSLNKSHFAFNEKINIDGKQYLSLLF